MKNIKHFTIGIPAQSFQPRDILNPSLVESFNARVVVAKLKLSTRAAILSPPRLSFGSAPDMTARRSVSTAKANICGRFGESQRRIMAASFNQSLLRLIYVDCPFM